MEIQQVVALRLITIYSSLGYSTDIAMLITAFLICMSVLAGQEAPGHTGCLARSEQGPKQQIDGKVYPLIEGFKLRVG